MGAFFEFVKGNVGEGLSLTELQDYYSESAGEVMKELDKNNDGQLEFSELKPMFKLADGTYDIERVQMVKDGVGDALVKKREQEMREAEEAFDAELNTFLSMVAEKVEAPVTEEELEKESGEEYKKYAAILNTEAPADFESAKPLFQLEEGYDMAALVQLTEALKAILAAREKLFFEKLAKLHEMFKPGYLKKLKLAKLVEAHPEGENVFTAVVNQDPIMSQEELQNLLCPDGKADRGSLEVVFTSLEAVVLKEQKKFDKEAKKLIKHIVSLCMGFKITRQEVFQVYIDEQRVRDFDKSWVKKVLNKPEEDIPDVIQMRKIFVDSETKMPDPNLVKGFTKALSKITDARRISISQANINLEMEFEDNLRALIETVDKLPPKERVQIMESLSSDFPNVIPTLIKMLNEALNGRLDIEKLKGFLTTAEGKFDIPTVVEITNAINERPKETEQKRAAATIDEDSESSMPPKRDPSSVDVTTEQPKAAAVVVEPEPAAEEVAEEMGGMAIPETQEEAQEPVAEPEQAAEPVAEEPKAEAEPVAEEPEKVEEVAAEEEPKVEAEQEPAKVEAEAEPEAEKAEEPVVEEAKPEAEEAAEEPEPKAEAEPEKTEEPEPKAEEAAAEEPKAEEEAEPAAEEPEPKEEAKPVAEEPKPEAEPKAEAEEAAEPEKVEEAADEEKPEAETEPAEPEPAAEEKVEEPAAQPEAEEPEPKAEAEKVEEPAAEEPKKEAEPVPEEKEEPVVEEPEAEAKPAAEEAEEPEKPATEEISESKPAAETMEKGGAALPETKEATDEPAAETKETN